MPTLANSLQEAAAPNLVLLRLRLNDLNAQLQLTTARFNTVSGMVP